VGRNPNYRLVKIHRSYTVEEVALLFGKHKNTVRNWIAEGLQPIDNRRPTLIHGRELARFLRQRRLNGKQPCPPGHFYCFKCRTSRPPDGGLVDYLPMTSTTGNIRAICPECGTLMHRRVALAKLAIVCAGLDIAFPQAERRISEATAPTLDCDSEPRAKADENA
jgi:Helix-turn-helix domain